MPFAFVVVAAAVMIFARPTPLPPPPPTQVTPPTVLRAVNALIAPTTKRP